MEDEGNGDQEGGLRRQVKDIVDIQVSSGDQKRNKNADGGTLEQNPSNNSHI